MSLKRHNRQRVMIGPREIAGVAVGLAEGFSTNGWDVALLDLNGNPFSYASRCRGFNRPFASRLNATMSWSRRHASNFVGRLFHAALRACVELLVFFIGVIYYDKFIFLFGTSYLPWNLDLFVYRVLGKKCVMIYCGSDSRPCYLNGGWLARVSSEAGGRYPAVAVRDRQKQQLRIINRITRSNAMMVDHPLSGHLQQRSFLSWLWMGLPTTIGAVVSPLPRGKVRFLHAPSNSTYKGSDVIRASISKLRMEGWDFDYEELSGLPNSVILNAIERSHVVIDELYSDIPLAGLGCEAAARGRVVVVGGYGWGVVSRTVPEGVSFPSIQVTPETLTDALRRLLQLSRDQLQECANAHLAFIQNHWASSKVASRYAAALMGEVPPAGWFEPSSVDYVWGCGAPKEIIEQAIRETASHFGWGFLVPAARNAFGVSPLEARVEK